MSKDFMCYFTTGANEEERGALIKGYIAALKIHHIYDEALFLDGAKLEAHILGNWITASGKMEDSMRTKARIITEKLNLTDEKKEKFHALLHAKVNDDDNAVNYSEITS